MKKQISKYAFMLLMVISAPVIAVQEGIIAPPPVNVVDDLGVNGATGQPVQKLDTVSIGGERGLSHNIQVYTNHFDAKAHPAVGYIDKFAGNASYSKVSNNRASLLQDTNGILTPFVSNNLVDNGDYLYVMRVFGPVGSHDFVLNADGATFSPVGDKRHSLRHEIRAGRSTLIWRTPEGIESLYWATNGSSTPGPSGASGKRKLRSIIYPDGFRLNIEEGAVTSNMGFMLKYGLPTQHTGNAWRDYNPNYIVGINLTEEYCGAARSSSCALTGWPIARFDWPAVSPQAFYDYEGKKNVFKVTADHGGITEYHYETQNICLYEVVEIAGQSQMCLQQNPGIEKFSPRLVAVKSAGSEVLDFRYTYKNDGRLQGIVNGTPGESLNVVQTYWNINTKEGLLTKVEHRDRNQGYGPPWALDSAGAVMARGVSDGQVDTLTQTPGVFQRVTMNKLGAFAFESNARNFVTSHSLGLLKLYGYDTRGNLNKVTAPVSGTTLQQALYPTSCTNSNFRYCNKPTWTKDAKGNQTDYTYHAESGQVKTVTRPAVTINSVSVRPKTTYEYSSLYAYYKKNSNAVERADDPIWMLTREFLCRTSNATESGCSAGDLDKVETNYYYGPQDGTPNNLFLRGTSVTGEGSLGVLETRVTCYEYDKYGRKIAETRPKGTSSLTSCP